MEICQDNNALKLSYVELEKKHKAKEGTPKQTNFHLKSHRCELKLHQDCTWSPVRHEEQSTSQAMTGLGPYLLVPLFPPKGNKQEGGANQTSFPCSF